MLTAATLLFNIIAFLFGLLVLKILCKLLRFSAKIVLRLVWNALIGALMLFVFNLIGSFFGLGLELSPFNAMLVGILGVPGVILLLLLG